jgi:GTP-binding protein
MPAPTSTRPRATWTPLFELHRRHVPAPTSTEDGPFRMLATTARARPVPRPHPDRAHRERPLKVGMPIKARSTRRRAGREGPCSKVLAFRARPRAGGSSAKAGDIVAIAGLTEATVSDTIASPEVTEPIPPSRSTRRRWR